MSQVIEVNKALDIVRKCCSDVMATQPWGKAQTAISQSIRVLRALLPSKPMEAGVPGAGLAITGAKTVARVIKTGKFFPFLPRGQDAAESAVETSPQALGQAIAQLQKAKETLKPDPCDMLMGCVAKGFRKQKLEQKGGGRGHYVSYDWMRHYAVEGTPDWQHVPRRVKHYTRRAT